MNNKYNPVSSTVAFVVTLAIRIYLYVLSSPEPDDSQTIADQMVYIKSFSVFIDRVRTSIP